MIKKKSILIIVLILLTVFNIAAIITIVVNNTETSGQTAHNDLQLPDRQYARWFRDELDLNAAQFDTFRDANRAYHHEGALIVDELQQLRITMLKELNKQEPDTVMLHELAHRVGQLHTELKEKTINYYLRMKSVCTPAQEEKLYQIFKSMVDPQGNASIPNTPSN